MQTFLPFADFRKSADILDPVRRRNQRRECKTIYNALITGGGWSSHPATKMWRGYEGALLRYSIAVCDSIISAGWKDNTRQFFVSELSHFATKNEMPHWLGNECFHMSHQSNLVRKDSAYYSRYFDVGPFLPYIWPGGKDAS